MAAREPFLLILNPDCELCPGALSSLRAALEQDAEAALAAPRVLDSEKRVSRGTWRSFPEPWKALMTASGFWRLGRWLPALRGVEFPDSERPQHSCRAEAVSGACMLIRTSSFRQMGGLDEQFGLHFEDLDLMYRLRRNHQYSLYVPAALAIHQQGVSSRGRPWWVHRQKHLGLQRFFCKHYASGYSPPGRWFVRAGIWLHYVLTLPLVPWRN
jgi:GT2 family glycosyltransferase